jgi:PAS domain S-box-containing protein
VWRLELEQPIPIDLPSEEGFERLMQYGYFAECNLAHARNLGFSTAEEMVGIRLRDLIPPSDQESLERYRASARGGWQSQTGEFRGRDKAGNAKYFLRTEIPIVENGMVVHIWGITRDITERKRADAELADRLRFETLLAELSARFVHVPAGQIDGEIKDAQRRVCESLALDACSLWQVRPETPSFIPLTHIYRPSGEVPIPEGINAGQYLPWSTQQILAGKVIGASSLEELPTEAARDRQTLGFFGIKSVLALGLSVGGGPIVGGLAFSTRTARTWPEELVRRLRVVAELFCSALERQRSERALRESEERFRSLFENATVGIYRTTPQGRIVIANPALVRMLGFDSLEELAARNLESEGFEPSYPRSVFRERMEREGQVIGLEAAWIRRDGSVIFVRESARAIRADDGRVLFYDGIVEDISTRRHAEEAVRRAGAYNRSLIEASLDPLVTIAPGGKITDVNNATEKVTGLSRQQLIGTDFSDYFTDPGKARAGYEQVFREGLVQDYELEIRRRDRHVTPVLYNASLYRDEAGDVIGVFAAARDISERKGAEEALRQLSGRLLRSQDEERRRIARQLHETAAQSLAGLAINLTIVKDSTADLSPRASACLSESLELAEQCSREIRTLSYLLHPPLVDEAGLVPALQWYAAGFAQRSGIELHVDVSPEFGRLPGEHELTLYRIVQEALTNIHLHSGSKTARISLERQPNEIVLTVADEGHGFPSAARGIAGPQSADVGVGIPGMRERLRQLGGRLHIQTGSRGTTLTAILPLGQVTHEQATLSFGG